MDLIVYGMMICPDCEEAIQVLDKKQIPYTFEDFSKETSSLKAFLKIRDGNPLFDDIRREGNIGIPCFVFDNGIVLLSLEDALEYLASEETDI